MAKTSYFEAATAPVVPFCVPWNGKWIFQARRAGIFIEIGIKKFQSSVRSEIL
jgi:hypothetical protein